MLQLFGKYVGTSHEPGLKWANPFFQKTAVSTRVRNFESGKLKVNDSNGSPIEIAAVVVWKVVDTAEALFEVDVYEEFVQIQSESALRNLSTTFPYEPHEGEGLALDRCFVEREAEDQRSHRAHPLPAPEPGRSLLEEGTHGPLPNEYQVLSAVKAAALLHQVLHRAMSCVHAVA